MKLWGFMMNLIGGFFVVALLLPTPAYAQDLPLQADAGLPPQDDGIVLGDTVVEEPVSVPPAPNGEETSEQQPPENAANKEKNIPSHGIPKNDTAQNSLSHNELGTVQDKKPSTSARDSAGTSSVLEHSLDYLSIDAVKIKKIPVTSLVFIPITRPPVSDIAPPPASRGSGHEDSRDEGIGEEAGIASIRTKRTKATHAMPPVSATIVVPHIDIVSSTSVAVAQESPASLLASSVTPPLALAVERAQQEFYATGGLTAETTRLLLFAFSILATIGTGILSPAQLPLSQFPLLLYGIVRR